MKDPIVQEGEPVLRQKAKPVLKKDFGTAKLKALTDRMARLLAKEKFGVAIAAPQVGESLRIFVVAPRVFETDDDEKDTLAAKKIKKPLVYINPELLRLSRKKKELSEGCLSVRGVYGTVIRHEKATVRAHDLKGNVFTVNGSGLLAHIFQHEYDHLDGILYIDRAERLREDHETYVE